MTWSSCDLITKCKNYKKVVKIFITFNFSQDKIGSIIRWPSKCHDTKSRESHGTKTTAQKPRHKNHGTKTAQKHEKATAQNPRHKLEENSRHYKQLYLFSFYNTYNICKMEFPRFCAVSSSNLCRGFCAMAFPDMSP